MNKIFRAKTTIEQWRIFQAVVEYGSYAKAADALNKSQSSLNHAVAKLQAQLGIALLAVEGKKTQLTRAGDAMLRRSKKLLLDVQTLEEFADTLNGGWEAEITIACEVIYPKQRLLRVLKTYWPQSRGSRLRISDEVISGGSEAVTNKSADIVLTPHLSKGISGNYLCDAQLLPICHKDHPILQQAAIAQDELASHLQIVIGDTGQEKPDNGWLKAEQRWTVSNFFEALTVLKQGLGFCWVPKHFIEQELLSGLLMPINLQGASQRRVPINIVIPDRENAGPGVLLLEQLILAEHQQERQ